MPINRTELCVALKELNNPELLKLKLSQVRGENAALRASNEKLARELAKALCAAPDPRQAAEHIAAPEPMPRSFFYHVPALGDGKNQVFRFVSRIA